MPNIWIPGQGPRLKRFRKAVGLTQAYVAEAVNCSDQTVLRWEHPDDHREIRAVPFEALKRLAALYHVTLAELLPDFDVSNDLTLA